jgi:asparagine synthase (glutamine-hydrolysing)
MTNSKNDNLKTNELGRHCIGVYSKKDSAKTFLAEKWNNEDTYIDRNHNEKIGIKFIPRYNKSDTLNFDEYHNRNITIYFSGDINNYKKLCDEFSISDSERKTNGYAKLSSLLYNKYGLTFPRQINGFFSIILCNYLENSIILYADRFGSVRPIYYNSSDGLIFSSQLKLLLQHSDISNEINEDSLAIFLKYSYVPAPRTIIRDVKKLGPGEILIYKDDVPKIIRYIDFQTKEKPVYSEKEATEKYIDLLGKSIKQKMEGTDENRVGFFLSGGLDSSANVALASLNGFKDFNTFGIGFEDPELDERPYARIVAKHFSVNFYDYVFNGSEIEDLPNIVWYLDEPFMENGLFLTYAGFKAAKEKTDLIIAGDGADQLFGTGGFAGGRPIALRYLFDKYHLQYGVNKLLNIIHKNSYTYGDNLLFKAKVMLDRSTDFNDWFFWGFDEYELKKLCNFPISKNMIECFPNDSAPIPNTLPDYYKYALIHQDIEHYVCQNVLIKSFRMAELFRINLREAYLDNDVIDFVLNLNQDSLTKVSLMNFIRGNRKTKYLHRVSMQNLLPREILNKPKQGGFIPMSILFSNDKIRDSIFKYILRSEFANNYLNISYIDRMLKEVLKSSSEKIYWYSYYDGKVNQIMNVLIISLWYDLCLKNNHAAPANLTLSQMIG